MDIKEALNMTEILMKARLPFALVGHSGVGKTGVLEVQAAELLPEHKFIALIGSALEPGDFVGLPVTIKGENGGKPRTVWARPEWMPTEPCVLFLDELSNIPQNVEAAALSLCYSKSINGHSLHPDSLIIAAFNHATSEYTGANNLSEALIKRFFIIPFSPTASEWRKWAKHNEVYNELVEFTLEHPDATGLNKVLDTAIKLSPCPRMLTYVGKALAMAEKEKASKSTMFNIMGCGVGYDTATVFEKWKKDREKAMTFKDLMDDYSTNIKKFKAQAKNGMNELINSTIDDALEHFKAFYPTLVPILKNKEFALLNESDNADYKAKALGVLLENFKTITELNSPYLNTLIAFEKDIGEDLSYRLNQSIVGIIPIKKEFENDKKAQVLELHAFYTLLYYLFDNKDGIDSLYSVRVGHDKKAVKLSKAGNDA